MTVARELAANSKIGVVQDAAYIMSTQCKHLFIVPLCDTRSSATASQRVVHSNQLLTYQRMKKCYFNYRVLRPSAFT